MPDFIALLGVADLTVSDVFILIAAVLAAWFFLSFAIGSPWYKVKDHGWIGVMTLLHSASVASLLFLIVWAIIFGQRVEEYMRVPISIFLAVAILVKIVILHHERRIGRLARRKARAARERETA